MTADSGWSSSLGVGLGLTTLPRKTQYLLGINQSINLKITKMMQGMEKGTKE
jgi:hypothetical protein